MSFVAESYIDDMEVSPANMNQLVTNDVFLFDRFLPMLKAACAAQTDYGFYVVNFSGASLVDPTAASGSGSFGATWTRGWPAGATFAINVAWPSGIFSAAPFILGQSLGSASQWGLIPLAHWAESATGYSVAFRDSGGDAYAVSSPFAYTALLLGPRSADPT